MTSLINYRRGTKPAVPDTFPSLLVRLSLCGNWQRPKRYGVRRYISLVDNALSESGAFDSPALACSIHNPIQKSSHHLPAVPVSPVRRTCLLLFRCSFSLTMASARYSITDKVHSLCHLNRKLKRKDCPNESRNSYLIARADGKKTDYGDWSRGSGGTTGNRVHLQVTSCCNIRFALVLTSFPGF